MFVRFGNLLMIVALLNAAGGQWAALQSVAWTTMFAGNLHSRSFCDAMTRTFDGQHPCPICQAIAAGKQSEKKAELSVPQPKLEFPPLKENFSVTAPAQFQLLPPENSSAKFRAQKPLLQPPRQFSV